MRGVLFDLFSLDAYYFYWKPLQLRPKLKHLAANYFTVQVQVIFNAHSHF